MDDIDTWIDVNILFFYSSERNKTKQKVRAYIFWPVRKKKCNSFIFLHLPCHYLFIPFFIFASAILTWNENRTAAFSKINKQFALLTMQFVWKLQCNCGIIYNFYFVIRLLSSSPCVAQQKRIEWKRSRRMRMNWGKRKHANMQHAPVRNNVKWPIFPG